MTILPSITRHLAGGEESLVDVLIIGAGTFSPLSFKV